MGGILTHVSIALIDDVALGDYLIVHAGFAITRLDVEEAEKSLALFDEIAAHLNRSIDALRRKRPTEQVDDMALASNYNLADEAERNSLMEKARGVIHLLPFEQRKTLEMAFFDGLTHSEIAEMTGDPLGTVKTRIRSALTSLRKAFTA